MFVPVPDEDVLRTPQNRLLGWLAGPDQATEAIAELEAAGFGHDSIYVISGEDGLRHLDPTGRHHGLRGRVIRLAQTVTFLGDDILDVSQHVAGGGVLVSVPTGNDEEVATGARVLRAHGADHLRHFGSLTYTDLE